MRWTQQQTRQRVQRLLDRVEPGHRGVLETFDEWLRDERCSAPATAAVRLQWVHDFLVEVVGEREVREALGQLRAGDIESYFVGCAERLSIATRRCVASTLRRFLQFAGSRGWSDANLVAAVPSVYCYSLSSVPVGISEAAIDQVISSLKPDRATHCRDKGILLLLATYGPRTGQISDLLLGDISWRERQITFCAQKRSRAVSQVLTPAVAEALALYIREYRPRVNHRHVFVNRRAPFAPLAPEAIRGVVAYRLRKAGIESGPVSPRAFRYALATRLLDARQPYKLIADTFGHQSLRATAVYTKMNRPFLEEAAMDWPDEVVE